MFEIRISPGDPTELKAVLQLVQLLAGMSRGPARRRPRENELRAGPEPPASTAEDAADAEEIVTIDIPSPPSGEPDPAHSAQQVLEALQDFARVNGAVGAEEGPGPSSARAGSRTSSPSTTRR